LKNYGLTLVEFLLAVTVMASGIATAVAPLVIQQSVEAIRDPIFFRHPNEAPVVISGNNIYVAWWSNETGNDEVMFRASTDNGAKFGDKINLSNSTSSDSVNAMIDSLGNRVFITWWERNAASNEPVLRISTDNGETFGAILKLATNGIIGVQEE
jgi:hypothetical protein